MVADDPYSVLGGDKHASNQDLEKIWKRRRNRLQPASERGDKEAERELQRLNAAWLEISSRRANEQSSAKAPEPAPKSEPEPEPAPPPPPPPPPRRAPHTPPTPPPRSKPQTPGVRVLGVRLDDEPPPWQDPLGRRARDVHVQLSVPWLLAFRGGPCHVVLDLGPEGERRVDFSVVPGCTGDERWTSAGGGIRGGDVVVRITEVRPHPHFKVDNLGNVHLRMSVSYANVYAGDQVLLPTPWGDVPCLLRPGDVDTLRIRGLGARNGSRRGDLIVSLEVLYPDPGNAQLGALLRELQRGLQPKPIRT